MALSKVPNMNFDAAKLRKRHKMLLRMIKLDAQQQRMEYKNYESTDSDLLDEDEAPKLTQAMVDECEDPQRKRRLETKLRQQQAKEAEREKDKQRQEKRQLSDEESWLTKDQVEQIKRDLDVYPKLEI